MLEVVRDAAGRVTAGDLNPLGLNQWSPKALLQGRLDLAVNQAVEFDHECATTYAKQVVSALRDMQGPKALEIIRLALGPGILELASARHGDSDPATGDAPSSGALLAELATGFGSLKPNSVGDDRTPAGNGNGGAP